MGNGSVLLRAALHLLPEMGRNGDHFWLKENFQLWGPAFFRVVGVTCIHVPVTVYRSGVQDFLCLV